ncbi:MAG: hypothetical protein GC137_07025 [Alphaproteobacteria bacterium]|nr:hypothetical protein [Alphaproteobacteria bacterium]
MNDDLEEDLIDGDEGFDEFSQKEGFADKIRKSAAAKFGLAAAAGVIIIGFMFMFGGEAQQKNESVIPSGSDVTSIPGTDETVSPIYAEAVEQQNESELERAIQQGDSTIPVILKTPDARLAVPETEEETEDPLLRWRQLQEERVEREFATREIESEPVTVLNSEQQSEAINNLAESMQQQMSSLLGANDGPVSVNHVTLIAGDEDGENDGARPAPNNRNENAPFEEEVEQTVIIPAGKIVYGQLLLEANSDLPTTVLAQMVSGPLRGYKVLGQFTLLEDLGKMAITFNLAVNDKGEQYTLNGVMLDPDTGLAALRTSINRRYFRRVVFPAAAAFVEGFAEALAETDTTTVVVEGGTTVEDGEEKEIEEEVASGVEDAAAEISSIIDEQADVPIQVIIAAGTPIAIFFTENVVDDGSNI